MGIGHEVDRVRVEVVTAVSDIKRVSRTATRLEMILLRSVWSRIDRFLAAILLTVAFAAVMPARGDAATAVSWLADAAIVLLFFMHGAKLSPEEALLGARHWRLHVMVFLSTFALFPLLGMSARFLAPGFLPGPLWAGLILLTALPSTVQASIVFTSVAGGNVPAAMCSATASSLLGVFLTPLIAGFLLTRHGLDISAHAVLGIVVQLLLPFVAGQLLRPWIGAYLARHPFALMSVDYGSILILVYSAFSHGVVDGIWHQIDVGDLIRVALVDIALIASRHVGLVVIPLMLFHQIQLMVCASLARHYAARRVKASESLPDLPAPFA